MSHTAWNKADRLFIYTDIVLTPSPAIEDIGTGEREPQVIEDILYRGVRDGHLTTEDGVYQLTDDGVELLTSYQCFDEIVLWRELHAQTPMNTVSREELYEAYPELYE